MADLTKQGVSAAFAENFAQAKRKLNDQILQTKYDAVKMQQTSLSAKAYAVADKWLRPIKYLHFDTSNSAGATLYATVAITNNESGFVDGEVSVEDEIYPVQVYNCSFSCVTEDSARYEFSLDYLDEESNVNQLSLLVAAYNVLQERGSILVNSWDFDGDSSITLSLVLTIPQDSHIDDYAHEIGECHVCGKPYYLSDYYKALDNLEEGEEVRCTNPDCRGADGEPAVLTGEALN